MSEETIPTPEEFLAALNTDVRALATAARTLILQAMPKVVERVYPGWGVIWYGTSPGMKGLILAISPQRSSVNLNFSGGTELLDPQGMLTGTGKRMRHVKLQKATDVEAPALRALIEAAVAAGPPSAE